MKKIAVLYKKISEDKNELLHLFKCENDEEFQNEFNKMYNNILQRKIDCKGNNTYFFEIKTNAEGETLTYIHRVLVFSPEITLKDLGIEKYVIYNIKWNGKGFPDHLVTYIEEPDIKGMDKKVSKNVHDEYIKNYIIEDLTRIFGVAPKDFEFNDLLSYEEASLNSYMTYNKGGESDE